MKSILFYSIVLIGLIGCGGGGGGSGGASSGGTGGGTGGMLMDPTDINLTKDILDGNIPRYDDTDPLKDQYLVVINYLRSLNLECDDAKAIIGPSNALVWNDSLENAAKEHSEDMKLSVHYAHDGSDTINDITGQTFTPVRPSKFYERISRNGYTDTPTAENIAMSKADYIIANNYWIKTMEGWIMSTHGHCSNIMNPDLTDFGMHESRANKDVNGWYKVYWTQDFGGH